MDKKSFDIACSLDTDEKIHEFLMESNQPGNGAEFIHVLEIAVKARKNNKSAFRKYCCWASKIVNSWPKWKKDILGK